MSKKRNYRKKIVEEEEEDEVEEDKEGCVSSSLQDRKELQRFRHRSVGVSADALLIGEKTSEGKSTDVSDPFKIKSGGGLTEMTSVTSINISKLGTNFSTETNQRDEDVQLLKYIEEGLKKNKGMNDDDQNESPKTLTGEDLLYQLPENINIKSKIKSEEMLSSQMLSGIPEVDLGIEAKIKNIEATEEAKMKIVDDGKNRKKETSAFVPTNMASDFMHHSRFYNEKAMFEKERRKELVKKSKETAVTCVDKGPTVGQDIVENNVDTNFMKKAMSSNNYKRKDNKDNTADDYMFQNFKKKAKEGRWR